MKKGFVPTPEELRGRVPKDARLDHITQDLRGLAVPIKSLLSDPRNARKHPEKNLEAVKASLNAYGQRKAVVCNSRTMIVEAGNGTLEAAKALGWEYLAVVFEDDDSVTASGYGLADNRTAELAEWDTEVLEGLLKDLQAEDVDLSSLGWDDDELKYLLKEEIDAGETPDLDDVEKDLGEEDETIFWPDVKFKLPPELFSRWSDALKATKEKAVHDQVRVLLESIHGDGEQRAEDPSW